MPLIRDFLRVNETIEELFDRCTDTENFDCSEEAMLLITMGPRRLPYWKIAPITVVLVLIFLTGLVGNVAVCFVIARNSFMRSATNYYLFSLAISDIILLLFGLPNDLSVSWHQYPYGLGIVFCKTRSLISEAASYASVLTIVAFSLERYFAICHPMLLYTMTGFQRAVKIQIALWIISLAAASPFAVYTDINYYEYPPGSGNLSMDSAFCAMLEPPSWYLCELSSLIFFIVPAIIILVLYTCIGLKIRRVLRSNNPRSPGTVASLNGVHGSVHGEARKAQSKKAILRMLVAVVVAFFVCWAPFHVQRLFFIYGASHPQYYLINEYLFYIAGTLYYVSATVNPILYNLMSNRFREAFEEALCCRNPRVQQSTIRNVLVKQRSNGVELVSVRADVHDADRPTATRQSSCSTSVQATQNNIVSVIVDESIENNDELL